MVAASELTQFDFVLASNGDLSRVMSIVEQLPGIEGQTLVMLRSRSVPAMIRTYLQRLEFALPNAAPEIPRMLRTELSLVEVALGGGRVKDKPGRARSPRVRAPKSPHSTLASAVELPDDSSSSSNSR